MSAQRVDEYLGALSEPQRSTLAELRRTIRELLPDAEEVISYGIPGYRLHGTTVAGYAAFTHHLSYFPHSGSTLASVPAAAVYPGTKSALHFPFDQPLPRDLVRELLSARLAEAGLTFGS
ncbi:MAG: iron chaperone [Actinomycetes bacterium]